MRESQLKFTTFGIQEIDELSCKSYVITFQQNLLKSYTKSVTKPLKFQNERVLYFYKTELGILSESL